MTVSLKHQFTSNVADSPDATLVQPSNWNAEHTLTANANSLLGTVTAGAVTEIACTAAGRALLDDADAAAQRTTLAAAGTGVTNTLTANQIIEVTDDTNAALRITQLGTGNALLVEDSTNPDSTPVVVDASGRLLAGITTARSNFLNASLASANLQVEGTGATASTVSVVRDSANANPPRFLFGKSRATSVNGNTLVQDGDGLGSITFQGNDGSEFVEGAAINAVAEGTPGTDSMPGRLEFHTSSAVGLVERMRIDSSGNVGIGTASPQSALNVVANSSSTSIGGSTAVAQIGNSNSSALGLTAGIELFASAAPSSGNGNRSAGIYGIYESYNASGNAGALSFATNPAGTTSVVERMRIDSSGNVGIGATPTAKLDVYGPSGVTSFTGTAKLGLTLRGATNATEYLGINFASLGGDVVARIGGRVTNSGSTIEFGTSNSYVSGVTNTAMMIDWNGNVGIGTTSPEASRALTLNSASNYFGIAFQVANTTHARLIQEATGALYIDSNVQGGANGGTVFRTGGTERMRIDSSGNVGIGTATPSSYDAKLAVNNGNIALTSTTNKLYLYYFSATNLAHVSTAIDGSITFTNGTTSPTERMRIDPSGNVSIGSTSTSYKLGVNGSIQGTYLNIDNGTGQSFVGMSIANRYGSGGTSFIDSQGINGVTDSHMFFNHYTNFASDITFATQPSGTNTDRRVTRYVIGTTGNFYPNADNAYTAGVSGLRFSAIWAANGTIQTSDARQKTDVQDSVLGLDFIKSLRPVSYKWIEGGKIVEGNNSKDENGDTVFNTTETPVPGTRTHFGLIAQEVKEALPPDVDFGGWILTDKNDPESTQALRYDQFISPLIKAVQEQQEIIKTLEARIAALEAA